MTTTPDPVDQRVGERIRYRRHQVGMTQQQLAAHLGLTFQQLQKYENATNRVSCSKLAKIATALGVPPGHFFDTPDAADQDTAQVFALSPRLTRALTTMPAKHVSLLADMAEALGEARG